MGSRNAEATAIKELAYRLRLDTNLRMWAAKGIFLKFACGFCNLLVNLCLLYVQLLHYKWVVLLLSLSTKPARRFLPSYYHSLQLVVEGNTCFGLLERQSAVDHFVCKSHLGPILHSKTVDDKPCGLVRVLEARV
jgi:hypothetical protein